MEKIQMTTPLVEMDGDEMTRILWKMIKDELILPFIDLKSEYYDLGLPYRDKTNDQVTIDSAEAAKKYGVAVKCATITPNAQRMEEYHLHKMWKSPNGTIRSIMDGTVFRAPITIPSIHPCVKNWEKPITIARHAYGDVYKSVELRADEPGVAKLVFEGKSGKKQEIEIHNFDGAGVIRACTIPTRASVASLIAASSLPSTPSKTFGLLPRTPSPRLTTLSSVRFSRRYMRVIIRRNSPSWASSTSIH